MIVVTQARLQTYKNKFYKNTFVTTNLSIASTIAIKMRNFEYDFDKTHLRLIPVVINTKTEIKLNLKIPHNGLFLQ